MACLEPCLENRVLSESSALRDLRILFAHFSESRLEQKQSAYLLAPPLCPPFSVFHIYIIVEGLIPYSEKISILSFERNPSDPSVSWRLDPVVVNVVTTSWCLPVFLCLSLFSSLRDWRCLTSSSYRSELRL